MTRTPNDNDENKGKPLKALVPRSLEDDPVDVTGIERSLSAYTDLWLAATSGNKAPADREHSGEEAERARTALLDSVTALVRKEVASTLNRLAVNIKDLADDHALSSKDPDGQVTDVAAKAFVSGLMYARAATILVAPPKPLDA